MNKIDKQYKCEICQKQYNTIVGLISHISQKHRDITMQQYYDTYIKTSNTDGICIDCGNSTKFISINKGYSLYCDNCTEIHRIQKIKNTFKNKSIEEINRINNTRQHTRNNWTDIQKDNFAQKMSIISKNNWNAKSDDEMQKICKKRSDTLLNKSDEEKQITLHKYQQTCIERYGYDNVMKIPEIKQKVSIINKSNKIQNKIKHTCINKYGVEHASQNKNIANKISQSNKNVWNNRSDDEKRIIFEKTKSTFIERYGVDNPSKSNMIKNYLSLLMSSPEKRLQVIETNINKYGKEWYSQTDEYITQVKKSNNEKYGKDWYVQTNEFKQYLSTLLKSDEKQKEIKQHNNEKYGKDWYSQTDEFRSYLSILMSSPEKRQQIIDNNSEKYRIGYYQQAKQYLIDLPNIQEKIQQTCLNKYGVTHIWQLPNIQQKIYETKKKNHTFNSSKIEILFKQYLIEYNYDFDTQYKSDVYPFNCDFYLAKYDLYVEINAFWTHGYHPYNPDDKYDVNILNEWKSKNTEFYNNAIQTWAINDVKKQQKAIENKLNYLVIYSNDINEVIKQFESYINDKKYGFYCYDIK